MGPVMSSLSRVDGPGQVKQSGLGGLNSALPALPPKGRTLLGRFAHVLGLVILRQRFAH
jgi:hypothetical protein